MEKKKSIVAFTPHNIAIPLVFLGLGATAIRLWSSLHPPFYKLVFYCLLSNIAFILYFSYYFFIYSKIIVLQDRLLSPRTNYNGMPFGFVFGKKVINIHSITKIIKYPPRYGRPYATFGSSLYGAKISIISKPNDILQISYGFYGESQVESLIEELLARNENIQIIKYDERIVSPAPK